jgi:hypothetical protein
MKKEDLTVYEVPSIAEYVSISWMQDIIARYTAWRVNTKWNRYVRRLERQKFIEAYEVLNDSYRKYMESQINK